MSTLAQTRLEEEREKNLPFKNKNNVILIKQRPELGKVR